MKENRSVRVTIPNSKATLEAVIFDLDGVLIDSMAYHLQSWKEAFTTIGISLAEEEIYEREGEELAVTVSELYRKHKGLDLDLKLVNSVIKTKVDAYERIFKLQIFPGAPQLLAFLKSRRLRLGLVTGSTGIADRLGEQRQFLDVFDVIITGEDMQNYKPAPDPYLSAINKLGVNRENCFVVENSPLGVRSAVAANLTCLAVAGTSHLTEAALRAAGAHFICTDLQELTAYLAGGNEPSTSLRIKTDL